VQKKAEVALERRPEEARRVVNDIRLYNSLI